jgi:large subunit ribosomal protein L35
LWPITRALLGKAKSISDEQKTCHGPVRGKFSLNETKLRVILSIGLKMTKQKTHKATKKRFRLTATGKAKHRKCGTSHLAVRKTPKRIRQLRGTTTVHPTMERMIQDCLRGNSL